MIKVLNNMMYMAATGMFGVFPGMDALKITRMESTEQDLSLHDFLEALHRKVKRKVEEDAHLLLQERNEGVERAFAQLHADSAVEDLPAHFLNVMNAPPSVQKKYAELLEKQRVNGKPILKAISKDAAMGIVNKWFSLQTAKDPQWIESIHWDAKMMMISFWLDHADLQFEHGLVEEAIERLTQLAKPGSKLGPDGKMFPMASEIPTGRPRIQVPSQRDSLRFDGAIMTAL